MQNNTVTAPVELPVVDSPLDPEHADRTGDDILLGAAATNRVQRVRRGSGGGSTWAPQSGTSRAWTMGGNVD